MKWVNIKIPSFSVVLNGDTAIASRDSVFYVDLYNYPTSDPNLKINWYFIPAINDTSKL
jgi:hypothetical protein